MEIELLMMEVGEAINVDKWVRGSRRPSMTEQCHFPID